MGQNVERELKGLALHPKPSGEAPAVAVLVASKSVCAGET